MYKIGEFSKKINISVRTLRYYDSIALLQPNSIDNFTGYRYYDDENLIEAELIKLLKSVNFTLKEIMEYKENFNFELLNIKQMEIKQNIKELKNKIKKLEKIKQEFQEEKPKIKERVIEWTIK